MTDDTRSRLVDGGLRLLREGGLDAVTLRAVGTLAGVSRTAPYRHFADKAALLATMGARIVGDLTRHVRAAYSGLDTPPARLRAFYESYVGYALAHPQEYRLVFDLKLLNDTHPELTSAVEGAVEELGAGLPLAGSPLRGARLLALVSSAHGLAEYALAGHFRHKGLDVREVIDALLDVDALPGESGSATAPPV